MIFSLVLSEDEKLLATLKKLKDTYVYTLDDLSAEAASRPELENPQAVFLQASGLVETIESVRSVRTELPQAYLIVVEDLEDRMASLLKDAGVWAVIPRGTTTEIIQDLLRGVPPADFPQALPEEGSGESLEAPNSEIPTGERENHTIAIISPKGGVGKTSITANLAIALAASHPRDIVLVDLDLQFGDICTHLDLNPRQTIEHALEIAQTKDLLALKALLAYHDSGFYVVPGAGSPSARDTITEEQLRTLLQQLARTFKYVLVDTGAGLEDSTLTVLEEATAALFVSTLDISAVRGLRKEIDVLKQLSLLPSQQLFVVNKTERNLALRAKDVEEALGFAATVSLERDRDVGTAVNRGVPLFAARRRASFSRGIASLASAVEKLTPKKIS